MTNSAARTNRLWVGAVVFLYGSLVASLIAFVLYRRQGLVEGTIDLNGFGAIARNIANGEGFTLGHGPTTRRGPLYPYLGGLLLKVFGSNAPGLPDSVYYRPLLLANCVFMGLTCVVVWRLADELFGRRIAWVAAALCPLVPQSVRYIGMTEVETFMGLCTVLLAYTGVLLVRRPTLASGVAFGVTAAAATLAKPVVLIYPFVFVALSLWQWRKRAALDRSAVVAAVAALACFGVLLVPWTLRNMAVTGGQFKGISSNGPGEFLRGYINAQPKYFLLRQDFGGSGTGEKWDPEANTFEENLLKPYGVPFFRSSGNVGGKSTIFPAPPPDKTSAMLELEKDRIEGAEMKRRIIHEPGAFIYKFCAQFASFWYVVETRTKSLLVGTLALGVLVFAGLGAWRARTSLTPVWPVLVVVLYFNAIYAVFLAFARYSMPLFPTLTVLAAAGLVTLLERLKLLRPVSADDAAPR